MIILNREAHNHAAIHSSNVREFIYQMISNTDEIVNEFIDFIRENSFENGLIYDTEEFIEDYILKPRFKFLEEYTSRYDVFLFNLNMNPISIETHDFGPTEAGRSLTYHAGTPGVYSGYVSDFITEFGLQNSLIIYREALKNTLHVRYQEALVKIIPLASALPWAEHNEKFINDFNDEIRRLAQEINFSKLHTPEQLFEKYRSL